MKKSKLSPIVDITDMVDPKNMPSAQEMGELHEKIFKIFHDSNLPIECAIDLLLVVTMDVMRKAKMPASEVKEVFDHTSKAYPEFLKTLQEQ